MHHVHRMCGPDPGLRLGWDWSEKGNKPGGEQGGEQGGEPVEISQAVSRAVSRAAGPGD